MRCSAWSSLGFSVYSALALTLAAPALAHVTASPSFIAAGETKTVALTVPNERDAVMSGFVVHVPSGFSIVDALRPSVGWEGTVRGATANWSGCCVEPRQEATFPLRLTAPDEPGAAQLEVRQLYPDGEHVSWTVPLTVVPGQAPTGKLGWPIVAAVVVLLLLTSLAVFLWRRRSRSLQER